MKLRRYMGIVGNNIIDEVGQYDGKYNSTVSLASHLIDVSLIGLQSYIHDVDGNIDDEMFDVLASALTLHDLDKVVEHKENITADSTDREVLDLYFENDWFEIESYLSQHSDDPIDEYEDILLYLIKRTEKRDSIESMPSVPPKFRRLSRYCELADSTVSEMTNHSDVQRGYDNLEDFYGDNELQYLKLVRTERPILHYIIVDVVEDCIRDRGRTVLGSTPTGILYLGDEIEITELVDPLADRVSTEISREFEFNCTANWRSVDYDALPVVDIPLDKKRENIKTQYTKNVLKHDPCDTEVIEDIPDEFMNILPEALHKLYVEGNYEFADDNLQDLVTEIQDEHHGSKHKILLIHKVLQNWIEYKDGFIEECKSWTDEFHSSIEPDKNHIESVIEDVLGIRFDTVKIPSSENVCHMCGQEATTEYNGDNTVLQTRGFSKRTSADQRNRKICETCQMEHALISSLVDQSDAYGDDIMMVYFYFDNFSSSLALEETADRTRADILNGDLAFDDDSDGLGSISLYNPLVHFQPITVEGTNVESEKNRKLRTVKDILERIKDTGMKARITTPFRPFEPSEEVFKDNNPVYPQEVLDATTIDRYEDLDEIVDTLRIGSMFQAETEENYPYQYVVPATAENIIYNAERKFSNTPSTVTLLGSYVHDYCKMSDMKTVAEKGLNLYGHQYQSKYKKVKIVRAGLDKILEARNDDLDRNQTIELVAGEVSSASQSLTYTVSTEDAEAFAESLIEYCDQFKGITELSDKKNSIVNTYKFAYERAMNKSRSDSD